MTDRGYEGRSRCSRPSLVDEYTTYHSTMSSSSLSRRGFYNASLPIADSGVV